MGRDFCDFGLDGGVGVQLEKKKIIPVQSISPVNPAAQDGTFKQSLKIPVTKSHFKGTFFVQAAFRLNVMLCSI